MQTGVQALPPLRRDFTVVPAGTDTSGRPLWTLHDPLQQRYFQIDSLTKEALRLWPGGQEPGELLLRLERQLGYAPSPQQLEGLVTFLRSSNLTDESGPGSWQNLSEQQKLRQSQGFERLAHAYLFFKLPLLRPDAVLKTAAPHLSFFYSRAMAAVIALAGLAGLYLVSREWSVFTAGFQDLFSFQGAVQLGLTIVLLKIAHEMGHAVSAARYELYVPSMGIAFMVMVPMLYTDVSDGWRLQSRRERLVISLSGIAVELGLACLATLLWAFLPEGAPRTAAFMVAGTAWISSLAFNLNPFMKFDGYYALCDLAGIDNLQPRAFALGRWKLRAFLLAPDQPPPERFAPGTQRWLIIYAWMTWIYRLILFTAIALMLYHMFFKLAGIALFALEIWLLLLRPVIKELTEWRALDRALISRSRLKLTGGLAAAIALLIVVPWSSSATVPAVLKADGLAQIYPPSPAQVVRVSVERGASVKAGDVLFVLRDPALERELEAARIKAQMTRLRLNRAVAVAEDREQSGVLRHEFRAQAAEIAGLEERMRELHIRAPASGRVVELQHNLHPGTWIGKDTKLALISPMKQITVMGYLAEEHVHRVSNGIEGRFVPDDPSQGSFEVVLSALSQSATPVVELEELGSANGGPITVDMDDAQKLIPRSAHYLAQLAPRGPQYIPKQVLRGVVVLDAAAESILGRAFRQVARVLVRESSF